MAQSPQVMLWHATRSGWEQQKERSCGTKFQTDTLMLVNPLQLNVMDYSFPHVHLTDVAILAYKKEKYIMQIRGTPIAIFFDQFKFSKHKS